MATEETEQNMYNSGFPFNVEIGLVAAEPYERIFQKDLRTPKYRECPQAAHVVIYADTNAPVIKTYNARAAVYMQLRFDGHLGFPGGMVDATETPEDAVNRELIEESGLEPGVINVTEEDLLSIDYSPSKNVIFFLYSKKIPLPVFRQLETKTLDSAEWANEVMGVVRVPLYTMADGFRGFPAFLGSNFIGNSKVQLLYFLETAKIMEAEEIEKALAAKPVTLRAKKQGRSD